MTRTTLVPLMAAALALPCIVSAAPLTYALPDETATFRPGAGIEVAQANCSACHSTDYINYQPSGKGAAFWEAEVTKMIKVYGAPITEDDAKTIAAYLASAY